MNKQKQRILRISRRGFLRNTGISAGMGAILTSGIAPFIWTGKRAHAAPTGDLIPSGGAIFFILNGGARTQAVFNGYVNLGTNPFGVITNVNDDLNLAALTVRLSKNQTGTGLDNGNGVVSDVNGKLNFLATCQHHNRTGNHSTGRVVACTGYTPDEDKPGILTVINHAINQRSPRLIPAINIGNDNPATRVGNEIPSTFVPIKITSPTRVRDLINAVNAFPVSPEESARLDTLSYSISDRFLRGTQYKQPADIPAFQRKAVEIAESLSSSALDIRTGTGVFDPAIDPDQVTNAALYGSFGLTAGASGNRIGAQAMLALRLRQLNCPAIGISTGNWDLHSNEMTRMPGRASDVGTAMAGLIDQMSQIIDTNDPQRRTLLDTTVITVLTDFNRGNWSVSTGFNGNDGSDHRSREDKTAFQCIPIVGSYLFPGGKVLGAVDGSGSPEDGSPIYETRQVLATVLDVLGIPSESYFPDISPVTRELI